MTLSPVLLFRVSRETEEERDAAKKFFPVVENRSRIQHGSLVIPRYSALPYFRELYDDCAYLGGRVIHTPRQHGYIADLGNYVDHLRNEEPSPLRGLTPPAWRRIEDATTTGPFVLKGATNSRKDAWRTMMYAEDLAQARQVYDRLRMDSFIEEQGIYIRPYWQLDKLHDGVNGMPVVREFRVFFLGGVPFARGFYWSNYEDVVHETDRDASIVPAELLATVAKRIGNNAAFYVADVARRANGSWCVVECNDGMQSGLSSIDPTAFYRELRATLDGMAAEHHSLLDSPLRRDAPPCCRYATSCSDDRIRGPPAAGFC